MWSRTGSAMSVASVLRTAVKNGIVRAKVDSKYGLSATRRSFHCSSIVKAGRGASGGPRTPTGPITWTSLTITGIVAAGLMAYYQIEKENRREAASGKVVETVGKPALGGPWVLVDQDGVPRTDASYFGQFQILYFGFTHCPDICPSELVKVGKILNSLGTPLLVESFGCKQVHVQRKIISM
jgi:hypothetical protein